jgi:magnesium chelatase family protein
MLTQVFASAVFGLEAKPIVIEVHIDKGIGYHLVGLPDNAVKESNYRIAAALQISGYKLPGKRITINLAPADLRKEGSAYDLPIAIGILSAFCSDSAHKIGQLLYDGGAYPRRTFETYKRGITNCYTNKRIRVFIANRSERECQRSSSSFRAVGL